MKILPDKELKGISNYQQILFNKELIKSIKNKNKLLKIPSFINIRLLGDYQHVFFFF